MDALGLLYPLIVFAFPLFGLALGAICPPFIYGKRTLLAAILNVMGFLIYVLPALFISIIICTDNLKGPVTTADKTEAVCLTLGIFLAVEGMTFLLRPCFRKSRA